MSAPLNGFNDLELFPILIDNKCTVSPFPVTIVSSYKKYSFRLNSSACMLIDLFGAFEKNLATTAVSWRSG